MLTPDGKDCPYYYANFHRRSSAREQCNLIVGNPDEDNWHSGLCKKCPVPQIKRANNCPTMQLSLQIVRRGLRFWDSDRVEVEASCRLHQGLVQNPLIGCGRCHSPLSFVVGTDSEGT